MEVPILNKMFEKHKEIDQAFKTGQASFLKTVNQSPTIQTETNVHLFGNTSSYRSLLTEKEGKYSLGEETFTFEDIKNKIQQTPEEFSNNVVTRPLMQEMLFNTAVFLGGGAEVSYWGELHKVFEAMNVSMPIVMKRMEFMQIDSRTAKLLERYDIELDENIVATINSRKEALIGAHTNDQIAEEIERVKESLEQAYHPLYEYADEYFNKKIIDGNKQRHINEL